jgi:LysM domain-containing protein
MSAMRAEELPEVPAASPQDSARNRAVVRWSAPLGPATTDPSPVTTDPSPVTTDPSPVTTDPSPVTTEPGPVARPPAARPGTARPQPAAGQTASAPLRLTRRGRVVVAIAAALLLAALSLVIAASAQATNHPAPPGAARQNLTQVIVHPGQSLWSVAENADPHADTRVVIQQIIELNGLTGDTVFAGQHLWAPRG